MCPNNELYAMHQRQLQLRKEQQQKNLLSASLSSALSSSTGILLGSAALAAAATSSPAGGNASSSGLDGAGGGSAGATEGGFNMMSPAEMSLDYQAESPMHDSKTGISAAEDEGGGNSSGLSAIGEPKSLLTSEGLQPSFNDLDHLFDDNMMADDNSNDESVSGGGGRWSCPNRLTFIPSPSLICRSK